MSAVLVLFFQKQRKMLKKQDKYDMIKKNARRDTMFCSKCGRQISDGAAFCPACGNQINYQTQNYAQPQQGYTQPQQGYAQPQQGYNQGYYQPYQNSQTQSSPASMILGIVGIATAFLFALVGHITSIIGIVLGVKEYRRTGKNIGLILSVIGEVCSVLSSLIGIIMMAGSFYL